ncbi:hypothetical protein IW140_004655 [Coemansia sp. RSA 1813]|nr:hypothetical protein EV178_004710 [Coemansia sp. RSA 1646]KAJ1767633.1 hypothetical protein LPJ74_005268 [Coemansia sp. RSA 1843]KAJ2087623.1 hypothetical protein IW138_004826 [Coemansia sp. RSA 986]KAJ2214368.1 hypothetical protein EV179_003033 [Coemansia sp. RSA 487]KAJ2567088.1 hypothetical protein IW140_004655 [Coemansia sp. RSA 1813]
MSAQQNAHLPDPSSFQILETTLYTHDGGLLLLSQHLDRMRHSARLLAAKYSYGTWFPVGHATQSAAETRLRQALPADQPPLQRGRARILLSADGSLDIQVAPIASTADAAASQHQMPRLVLDTQPTENLQTSPFVACKTTHRHIYDTAAARALGKGAAKAYPEGSLVLLHNTDGRITEANIANVAVSLPVGDNKGGEMRLVTPPVRDGLLAGTMRSHLLESGQIVEGAVTVDDFKRAVRNGWRVVCMNSVRGMFDVAPVVSST